MSYYNFNDHFWSPKKVCSQLTKSKTKENISQNRRILAIFSLAFISLGIPLLLPRFGTASNEQQGGVVVNNNLGDRCIIVGRERVQIYCSGEQ